MPLDKDLYLTVAHYSPHKHQNARRWQRRHPHFHFYCTAPSPSWLNMVGRFLRDLTQNRLRRGVFCDVPELGEAVQSYFDKHNENPVPFIWTGKAADILAKVKGARKAIHSVQSVRCSPPALTSKPCSDMLGGRGSSMPCKPFKLCRCILIQTCRVKSTRSSRLLRGFRRRSELLTPLARRARRRSCSVNLLRCRICLRRLRRKGLGYLRLRRSSIAKLRALGDGSESESLRTRLDDLEREDVREMLRSIWTEPPSLDSAWRSARVTADGRYATWPFAGDRVRRDTIGGLGFYERD